MFNYAITNQHMKVPYGLKKGNYEETAVLVFNS